MDTGILRDLLSQGEYSDMKISCKGRIFNVHRAVVCPQSSFFKTALNGKYAVSPNYSIDMLGP